MTRAAAYYLAAISAILGPLWMPDPDARGWLVALFVAWCVVAWTVFVWNAPRPHHWPTYCDCCGGIHQADQPASSEREGQR